MARKASVFRLDEDTHEALTTLGRLLHRPLNALVNEAVRGFLMASRQEELEIQGTLSKLRDYRERELGMRRTGTDDAPSVADAGSDILDAAREFVRLVAARHPVKAAFLFGSRARGTHRDDSDVDIALILAGERGNLMEMSLALADIAFEVLLSRKVYIQPLPIWECDWEQPEGHPNPRLIENIRREGRAF